MFNRANNVKNCELEKCIDREWIEYQMDHGYWAQQCNNMDNHVLGKDVQFQTIEENLLSAYRVKISPSNLPKKYAYMINTTDSLIYELNMVMLSNDLFSIKCCAFKDYAIEIARTLHIDGDMMKNIKNYLKTDFFKLYNLTQEKSK